MRPTTHRTENKNFTPAFDEDLTWRRYDAEGAVPVRDLDGNIIAVPPEEPAQPTKVTAGVCASTLDAKSSTEL